MPPPHHPQLTIGQDQLDITGVLWYDEGVKANEIQVGDRIRLAQEIETVSRVAVRNHVLTGAPLWDVYRQVDGRLFATFYDDDEIVLERAT